MGRIIFSAVCRKVGLKVEFKSVEWDHIFDGLNAGEYDAIAASVTITPERRAAFDFTIRAISMCSSP